MVKGQTGCGLHRYSPTSFHLFRFIFNKSTCGRVHMKNTSNDMYTGKLLVMMFKREGEGTEMPILVML